MFFAASKIFGFLASPSNLAAVVGLAGVVLLLTRRKALSLGLMAGGIVSMLLLGFSPVGNLLMLTLTERFPAWTDDGRVPVGIIVLGGAISPEISAARNSVELDAAAERMTVAAELSRRFGNAKIVFSGGSANLIANPIPESDFAKPLFESFGIARERIVMEGRSRNTWENAVFSRDLLKPKPGDFWLLVTSANHMPRSMGAFRAAGFDVVPYPVDWRTRGWNDAILPFSTLSSGLARTDTAVREWIGLVAYRLAGQSDALFPAPR